MAENNRIQSGILGDIRPTKDASNDRSRYRGSLHDEERDDESMEGGSKHDRTGNLTVQKTSRGEESPTK